MERVSLKKKKPKEKIIYPTDIAKYLKDVLEYAREGLPITVICPDKDYLKRCRTYIQGKRGNKLIDFEIEK